MTPLIYSGYTTVTLPGEHQYTDLLRRTCQADVGMLKISSYTLPSDGTWEYHDVYRWLCTGWQLTIGIADTQLCSWLLLRARRLPRGTYVLAVTPQCFVGIRKRSSVVTTNQYPEAAWSEIRREVQTLIVIEPYSHIQTIAPVGM